MSKKKKIKLIKNEGPLRTPAPPRVTRVASNVIRSKKDKKNGLPNHVHDKKGEVYHGKTKKKAGAAADPEPVPGSDPQVKAEPPKPADPLVPDPKKDEPKGDPKPGRKGLFDWDNFFDRG